MILTLSVEDFRGQTATYSFGRVNHLRGKNEAGKTTVREAIAFLFTGADSAGNRAPVHLIGWGKEMARVSVQTDKATIQRSLTRKKTQTIKLVRGDVPATLTQTQIEELLGCTADLFLAVFVPGFFWTLPLSKQQSILSEVMPPFDVDGFVSEFTGTPLSADESVRFGFAKKRPDLVGNAIANERRELQRRLDINEGRARALESSKVLPSFPGEQPPEAGLLAEIDQIKSAWNAYNSALSLYRQADAARNSALQTNAMRQARRSELQAQLSSLPATIEAPAGLAQEDGRLNELRSSFKSKPEYPQLIKEVDSDNCPTCGQVVGLKHKDKVRADNNRRLVEYEESLQKVEAHNNEVQKAISVLLEEGEIRRAELRKIQDHNESVRRTQARLEGELAGLTDIPVPTEPVAPVPPSDPYDATREQELRLAVEHHKRRLAEYNYAKKQLADQAAELDRIRAESQPLLIAVDRLQKLEEAAKALPEARLKQQAQSLLMQGYEIEVNDSSIGYKRSDGCPYSLLSTGHAMRADVSFSMKLNSLMRRPINLVFLDNADLVDEQLGISPPVQVFAAYVDSGVQTVVVEKFD